MIGVPFFSFFFSWIFEGYTQNIQDTEQSHWNQYKKISILFNKQCFLSDFNRIFEKQISIEKKEESNTKIRKDSENLIESLFISFEEWKKYSTFDTSDKDEKKDFNNNMNDFKKSDHQIYMDYPIKNQKNELKKQICISHQNSTQNLSEVNNYLKVSSKERFNYASVDCAATVLEANSEAKGYSSILSSDKDQYMLNKCSAVNKFVVVELCNDILVDTIVLGNLEFFSSTFKDFRISVSDRYPVEESQWKELGAFTAMNIKDIQIFTITNPLIWAKYMRIDFLTHYGNEFYCPITFLKVYGTTMIEELKYDDNEFKENTQINHNIPSFKNGNLEQQSEVKLCLEKYPLEEQKVNPANPRISEISSIPFQHFVNIPISIEYADQTPVENISNSIKSYPVCLISILKKFSLNKYNYELSIFFAKKSVCSILNNYNDQRHGTVPGKMDSTFFSNVSTELFFNSTIIAENSCNPSKQFDLNVLSKNTLDTQSLQNIKKPSLSSNIENTGVQRNIYKTISKRLSFLEINTTLYLQYIEQQSKLLRDIFVKMEKKNEDKMDFIIQTLNSSLFSRLNIFRNQYEELRKIITTEIEYQRNKLKEDMNTITLKLEYLSNEILIQRCIIIIQFLILLGIFIFFVFR
ncbi:hypothetical protein PCANB_001046 [Pneumocystis canis]|nr:hypothetical protein PCK1_001102 [Pneumocystis canis]KAG5437253.1 hypothetical protein PCANB_001046 [Pneumocystis canis]